MVNVIRRGDILIIAGYVRFKGNIILTWRAKYAFNIP